MGTIKKVDFSKFAQEIGTAKDTSSQDSPFIFMAKAMIPSIPRKIKYAIVVGVYFIISGLIANAYIIIKLISKLF